MDLTIRECNPSNDINTIVKLERSIFRPNEQYTLGFINWLCKTCTNYSFIAFLDNKPAGFIVSCIEGFYRGHIISIGILSEFRRRGIGKALMIKSICSMIRRGINHVILETRVSNTPAISLYRKLGFTERSLLRSYYNDGEDAYLMFLDGEKFEEFKNKYCKDQ